MTPVDRLLQRWRVRKALPHLRECRRVLDIGTYDGTLFRLARVGGVGIDPELPAGTEPARPDVALITGHFPGDLGDASPGSFDAATALAVLEHVPEGELPGWADQVWTLLRPGGLLVCTVPSPAVDRILHVLMRLRIIDGMETHQHHGFVPDDLLRHFAPPRWALVERRRFQLGLNNLFVFRAVRETC